MKKNNKQEKNEQPVSKAASKQEVATGFMAQRRLILGQHSSFHVREAYKTLRTNIRFFLHNEACKRICITSSTLGEGKSITMLNLAISFAEDGKKVLLVDADMRRPALARLLIEKMAPGLSNVLAGINTPEEAIRKEIYPNLDVLFSGDIPPNPSELLGDERMQNLMDELAKVYDYILVDTPPVNMVSDTCIVANAIDGVLYLVRQGKTDRESVSRGINQLRLTGAKQLGFVINGMDMYDKRYITEYR